MNPKSKKELRVKIKSEIITTQNLVNQLKEHTKPIAPENAIGRVSRMDAINNKSVNEAALRNAEKKLSGLLRALDELNTPSFGVCIRCNNEIPLGRILLVPQSKVCVHCAS